MKYILTKKLQKFQYLYKNLGKLHKKYAETEIVCIPQILEFTWNTVLRSMTFDIRTSMDTA